MTPIAIRPLERADFDQLIALFETVAAERRWIGTEPGFDQARFRARWHAQVGDGSVAALVALSEGRVAGFAGTYSHAEYGIALGMLVSPGQRGRGIGEGLLRAIIDWARARGLPEISLLVFPHNAAAIGLYRKLGFIEREYNRNDVTRQTGEVWDSIAMTKTLT